MNVTSPPPDEPELFSWWQPLIAVARRVRDEHEPFAIHLDEFAFRGWVHRRGKAALSVYEYVPTRSDLVCDDDGQTYAFHWFDTNPEKGRIKSLELFSAMLAAGLPMVPMPDPSDWAVASGYFDDEYESPPRHHSRRARPWARSRARLRVVR
jgi:hypothetical protein